ncbi:MAG: hypothetical protein PHG97_06855 [Candidatus Margulisbacteria bacterium]|nr:hypothetical protein [Candidatus Margulisiibacteriota bacterium]
MNSRDVVVRIIQPLEQPQPLKKEIVPTLPVRKEKNLFHSLINGVVLSAIGLLAVFIGVSFFHLGVSFNDILILVGIPMTLGIVTSYAIL